ncbi:unnamed protein product [Aphis gossypii]|uniref:Tudor domain-containing protein 5 n=1 Tax=Aphis gossypii TaxID=80765 RepID=A0A9P0J6W8_APHGO|nr:unnamed protein product [Aphis gossypii]
MEQPDLNYLKMVIRSILTSSPSKMTISQILSEYSNYEGCNLSFEHLGFKTIYELLENMTDVLRIPHNPSMNSIITLIVGEKTSHLRELVINQKTKKQRPRRNISTLRSNNNHLLKSANYKSRVKNHNNHRNESTISTRYEYNTPKYDYRSPRYEYSTPRYDTSARGYDHVKTKSVNSKFNGTVTTNLRSGVENLCNTSEIISIYKLKNFLINHPDYKKMGTSNIEESINMLKHFIYIDKGGVHLKDSPFEIFPSKNTDTRKCTKPIPMNFLNGIVDENEEMLYLEQNDNYFDEMDDFSYENPNISENEHKISQTSITTTLHDNTTLPNGISPQKTEGCQTLSTDDLMSQLHKPNQSAAQNLVNMFKTDLNNSVSKNNHIVPTQISIENKCLSSTVQQFTTKPSYKKIVSKKECEKNGDMKNSFKTQKDDYKSAIVAIIARSNEPITVNKVLSIFQKEKGYAFPFQKFFCRTYMDFFRLYPDMFKLEDQCSTNSVVSLEKQIILEPKTNIRKQFNKASIFNNVAVTNSENKILNNSKIISELISNKSGDQINKYPLDDNLCQTQAPSVKSIDSYEMYDSDTVLDTMKVKMRRILSKHKDGILCNDFMDVYGNEYNSHFNFSEYGFRSMRDMAYKLPSVFYVKVTDDDNDCILFEADRRSELENNLEDPSQYYKNIPKTILYNLSDFFNKYRNGVKFNELMSLYCAEYGRAYEPLKYGYSSEKHMFEALDKMVEIENNELFTIDPFAYTKCLKNKDEDIDNYDKSSVVLMDHDFLLHYSGKDICNGKFRYSKIKVNNQKLTKVIVAEIYNPSSFYIQLAAEVNNLNSFMDRLQVYYNNNEEKYKVVPNLILPEMACTSRFEDSKLWHRATVLKIVDEENVQLLYVDYGSIEVIPKTNVRLLASQFGAYPTQAVYCGLYNFNELNYSREISESFAEMTEDHVLEAQFHLPKSEGGSQKMIVTLFLNTEHEKININKKCSKEIINQLNTNLESIRRMIYRVMQEKQ